MNLDPVAKIFIVLGIFLVVVGIGWQFGLIQQLRLGRLPGDIRVERENFRFYFPLTTCVLLSVVLMLLSWLFRR